MLLLLLGQLSACGFHLRGQVKVPEELKLVYLTGSAEFSPLTLEVKKVLLRAGVQVIPSAAEAESVIAISNEQSKKVVVALDSQGRVAEYELFYSYYFTVTKREGEVIVPLQKIEQSRSFKFDPNNVLAKESEEVSIRKQMLSFAVRQMMQRIEAYTKSAKPVAGPTS
jgi:LPS-assembly lipoprotein